MKESVCTVLDEEINNLVNEEAERNGFNLDEFVNAALREKFKISSRGDISPMKLQTEIEQKTRR